MIVAMNGARMNLEAQSTLLNKCSVVAKLSSILGNTYGALKSKCAMEKSRQAKYLSSKQGVQHKEFRQNQSRCGQAKYPSSA